MKILIFVSLLIQNNESIRLVIPKSDQAAHAQANANAQLYKKVRRRRFKRSSVDLGELPKVVQSYKSSILKMSNYMN